MSTSSRAVEVRASEETGRTLPVDLLTRFFAAPDLVGNHNAQFWALQLVGWFGWALTWMAAGLYWGVRPSWNLAVLAGMATGMILTGLLREFYKLIWERGFLVRLALAGVASYVVAAAWQVTKNVALLELYDDPEMHEKYRIEGAMHYFRGVLTAWYIILGWSALYFGIKYYRMLMVERARAAEAVATARDAQLRMLRYQLNPHFLFNTLNAISTLVLAGDAELANRMVTRLSSFLRHSLDGDPTQKVDLNQEIRALRLYLDIEQVRFEDRLRVDLSVDAEAGRALVPGLILQPLLENAIKYAVARSEDGGTIAVRARRAGGALELEVEDDGPGLPEDFTLDGEARGVGLRNTRDRLRQLYGDAHRLELGAGELGGLRIRIRLPFETGSSS